MKTIHLAKDNNQWLVKYDEESQTINVEGPDPEGQYIYQWLTTSKHAIHQETGTLISIIPTQSWTYMKQVLDVDFYNDLGIVILWDQIEEP